MRTGLTSGVFALATGNAGEAEGKGDGTGKDGNSTAGAVGRGDGVGIAGPAGIMAGDGTTIGCWLGRAGVTGGIFGAGAWGAAGLTGASANAISTGFFNPLFVSGLGHWPATVASPPSDTPNTPAIIFQRDHDMV